MNYRLTREKVAGKKNVIPNGKAARNDTIKNVFVMTGLGCLFRFLTEWLRLFVEKTDHKRA